MKSIRSAVFGALLVAGTAAVVSAQQPTGAGKGHRGFRNPSAMLLRGITLSDAEKANVKNVHTKYAQQEQTLREQLKPQLDKMRDARQRGDTLELKNLRASMAGARKQQRSLMQSERNDLRASLSPANQTKFDANVANVKQRVAKHIKKNRATQRNGGA